MNKEIKELRRVATLAGIEMNWFGEVISNKTQKFYAALNKAKGCNLNIFNKVLKEVFCTICFMFRKDLKLSSMERMKKIY